jgi:hypothetical protein
VGFFVGGADQPLKPRILFVPAVVVEGRKESGVGRGSHHRANVGERTEFAKADRLHQTIAERGGYRRTSDDRTSTAVGGHLAEKHILGAAADDVDGAKSFTEYLFHRFERPPIPERETFQTRPYQ